MAMSILFCTENVLYRGKVLKKGFVRRGGTIFHGEDLSAVVLWRVYVGSMEMWKKPIGKGDTLESRLWAFYRDWPYRRKNGSIFLREKSSKMTNLACLRLSEELFEVWLVEIVQFFMANSAMIVVSGQTLLKNSFWRNLPVNFLPIFSYFSALWIQNRQCHF